MQQEPAHPKTGGLFAKPPPVGLISDTMPHDLGGVGHHDEGGRILVADDLLKGRHLPAMMLYRRTGRR